MFNRNCSNCGKSASKKYEFCPFCGVNYSFDKKASSEDYGFLGKEDVRTAEDDVRTAEDDFYAGMPLPFKMMIKPLMKELNKQMNEMGKETREEQGKSISISKKIETRSMNGGIPITNFSIYIGAPGQKPIHINGSINPKKSERIFGNLKTNNTQGFLIDKKMIQGMPVLAAPMQSAQANNNGKQLTQTLKLPKFDKDLNKKKNLDRKEPETKIRRLADRIVYEISLPGVSSIKNVNIVKVEKGFEIKSYSDKILYNKNLSIELPLADYFLEDDKLFLEFLPNK